MLPAVEVVADGLPEDVSWVGVDDVHRLDADGRVRLRGLLSRAAGTCLLSSRTALDDVCPPAWSGRVSARDATDLRLGPYEVARVLADRAAVLDTDVALAVSALTGGWPMLVGLAAEALARNPQGDVPAAVTGAGTPGSAWVRTEVLPDLPADVVEVLRALVAVDPDLPISPDACSAAASVTGCRIEPGLIDTLTGAGLLVPGRGVGRREVVLVPAVAAVLRQDAVAAPGVVLAAAVADAHEAAGAWLLAARARAVAGDPASVWRLVRGHGEDMLRGGGATEVVRLAAPGAGGPPPIGDARVARTLADAHRMSGDAPAARRRFAPLVEQADAQRWDAGLSARVAALHYLTGDFDAALDVLDRCRCAADGWGPGEDAVDWWAGRVHVQTVRGHADDASAAAARCLELAEHLGEPRPLGVAHLAMARTCRGELKDLHHERAVEAARSAGDAVTLARALAARTCLLLARARYDLARPVGEEAVRMARAACPPALQAVTLHNLGEILARTGHPEEALWHLECSIALCRRLGPSRAALGLVGLAEVHRSLGHEEQSRLACTEAARLARGSGDTQVLVSALCGLALLAAGDATDEAETAVAEAFAMAPEELGPLVLTTRARIAAARGDRRAAADLSRGATECARTVGAVDWLADALEVEAATTDDASRARTALNEALAIWSTGGASPAVARVEVLLGRLPDADGDERARGRGATRRLRAIGVEVPGGARSGEGGMGDGRITVSVLGPFTVGVQGHPVALPQWRSKQARTFVKILAAQRGRVVTRERLCDLLWPDDDPARTGHRLSVLLTTVRGVLDPSKAWPPDRYVVADQHGLRLALDTVVLDADLLLREAAHAVALLDAGDRERALEVLTHVDTLYRGEAFDDETEEWADGLREEVRAAWIASARRLAALRSREGRGVEALGILVRLLGVDPYDEQVHRRLVTELARAGRHGEARRAFQRWCRAMHEIDASPPDPDALAARPVPAREAVAAPRRRGGVLVVMPR